MADQGVTITVTNWNGRRHLEACLSAIAAQTLAPLRVILVDNASTDDGPAFVRERFPQVEILSLPTNAGPCAARNAGLRAATTDWVLQIDNDAVLAPDCLERLMAEASETHAVLHPRSLLAQDPGRIHYDGARFHYCGQMLLRHFHEPLDGAAMEPVDLDGAISVALLIDRRKILDAGGWDERHFFFFEDHELSMRLRVLGHRILHVPRAIVRHGTGTEGLSFREPGQYVAARARYHARNRWIVLLKCHSFRALILGLPGIALYEVALLALAVSKGHFGAWLRGKLGIFPLLPGLWRDRRALQRRRRVPDRDLLTAAPLTVTPQLDPGAGKRLLDRGLMLWWSLARRFL